MILLDTFNGSDIQLDESGWREYDKLALEFVTGVHRLLCDQKYTHNNRDALKRLSGAIKLYKIRLGEEKFWEHYSELVQKGEV